ncbi:7dacb474-de41-4d35-b000-50e808d39aeb [Thermothielavioides terrestris]|uniref:7dacb474-de41-4d35-b000-50e808d39aeb n=1 Tax=Thermothielavioides terrestris TaxID=2587410 RepID=A0A3S4AVF9_9PEZI|nr:7dacb474-de41-4d35-b000-50e808d39aeb [Thermothielavioides terrestris]
MALRGRDVALAGVACFIAWGYAVNWFPVLRWAGHAFVGGVLLTVAALLAALLALVLLSSRGGVRHQLRKPARPRAAAFLAPDAWTTEVAALRRRQAYAKTPFCPEYPRLSAALDEVLENILRDFIRSWYGSISSNPVFTDEVDKAIRGALLQVRDRLQSLDLAEVITTRLVPIMTAHFRDFADAERSVRGRKLNRSVTETEELDLAIASKYKRGKLHPAANLAFSDTKTVQQDYLRQTMSRILPRVLPESLLASRAVSILIREITACAVMFPVMQMLSDPDTWNQLMENYGRTVLQDRSTVRRLRAALDQHASPAPKSGRPIAFPRLTPTDSERRFEKFIRAIRKLNNLSDARRFRSEVASQLKRDSQQENADQVYLRRLEMGKRLLDQRVQHLAAGGGRRPLPPPMEPPAPSESRLEHASLAELLRDPSALSYFMEYMDRQRLMPMVQFWLVVDGFRNPLEDDGPEGEQLPLQLPPWTESDRLDLAQIDAAYLSRPELKVPDSSKRTIQEFLQAGKQATPEQYYRARRAILRAQSAVLEEMRVKYLPSFKKSDLFFKALAAEEASRRTASSTPVPRSGSPLPRTNSYNASKPSPVPRLGHRLHAGPINRRSGSTSDLNGMHANANNGLDPLILAPRRSVDEPRSPPPLFDEDEAGEDALADSVASLDQDASAAPPVPDTKVVQAMEQALNDILEESKPPTTEDLRASLFGYDDAGSGIFSPVKGRSNNEGSPAAAPTSKRGSVDLSRSSGSLFDAPRHSGDHARSSRGSLDVERPNKGQEKPSLASLGLVSAASRIGVFVDDDLFGDEGQFLSDEPSDSDGDGNDDDADAVHEAAPGDLGLAEAITALTNDIDKLYTQEAVVDSLLKKAELTNNMAELRILRKSKASLQREIRRKELQRQQYVIQESDNSLYGRSTIKIKSIQVGREEDGKEFAVYAIEVSRNAGERMPAATWVVYRRYSEFLELHQKLRSRYPSVRNLDFPRRRVVMKLQSEFLQKRRAALEKYLSELLLLPDVCRSRDLRAFLSQSVITAAKGGESGAAEREDGNSGSKQKDMISRLYDSVADGMEDILGSIPVLDQLSLAGQNLIAAATNQLQSSTTSLGGLSEDAAAAAAAGIGGAEAEAELNAFESKDAAAEEPFVKPICDIFLEVFELNRGNNWLRGRAVVVVLHQLLGGTIERKLRENVRALVQEDAMLRYVALLTAALWPSSSSSSSSGAGGGGDSSVTNVKRLPRSPAERARTRTEASLTLATLVPDLAGSVVGRQNAQAASRRVFATFNNARLNAHLAFTLLDELVDILFGD